MKEQSLLEWLYADIDELIDFDGYNNLQEEINMISKDESVEYIVVNKDLNACRAV